MLFTVNRIATCIFIVAVLSQPVGANRKPARHSSFPVRDDDVARHRRTPIDDGIAIAAQFGNCPVADVARLVQAADELSHPLQIGSRVMRLLVYFQQHQELVCAGGDDIVRLRSGAAIPLNARAAGNEGKWVGAGDIVARRFCEYPTAPKGPLEYDLVRLIGRLAWKPWERTVPSSHDERFRGQFWQRFVHVAAEHLLRYLDDHTRPDYCEAGRYNKRGRRVLQPHNEHLAALGLRFAGAARLKDAHERHVVEAMAPTGWHFVATGDDEVRRAFHMPPNAQSVDFVLTRWDQEKIDVMLLEAKYHLRGSQAVEVLQKAQQQAKSTLPYVLAKLARATLPVAVHLEVGVDAVNRPNDRLYQVRRSGAVFIRDGQHFQPLEFNGRPVLMRTIRPEHYRRNKRKRF